jgi:hypothetical protein
MGLAPGGLMKQDIYQDSKNGESWRMNVKTRCCVHLLNSAQYQHVTGSSPPTMPPTAKDYTEAGLPWFDYYRDAPALEGGKPLKGLDSVAALGIKKGEKPLPENEAVSPKNVKVLTPAGAVGKEVRDGEF